MGSQKLAPPMLYSSIPYRSWKNKLQMWTMVYGADKKEQGIIVLLQSLSNNKKKNEITDKVLTFKLLAGATISENQRQM